MLFGSSKHGKTSNLPKPVIDKEKDNQAEWYRFGSIESYGTLNPLKSLNPS